MTFGWMLFWGVGLLLLLAVIAVARTSAQMGDCSIEPMQRFELPSRQYGHQVFEDECSIRVAQQTPLRVTAAELTPQASRLVARLSVPTATAKAPYIGLKGIREVRVNGGVVYDGLTVSELTLSMGDIRQVHVNGTLVYEGEVVQSVKLKASNADAALPGPTIGVEVKKKSHRAIADNVKPTQISSVNPQVPLRGLVIMSEPLQKILSGRKTLELRKKNNKIRGCIALIQKGSGMIVGVANIGDCVGPMNYSDFAARTHEHGVEVNRLRSVFDEGYAVGWKLSNARRLSTPVAYTHKPGAVTWVTLDESDRAALGRAMGIA